ncbi:MAG TPA: hypothetical protein VHK90_18610 [Thermoanaerobaculia bacterium]|nr:hypothetical protein [Thermoanaerobaculia bacterium]
MARRTDPRKAIRESELRIHKQIETAWNRLLAANNLDFPHRPVDLMRPGRSRSIARDAERYLQPWLRLFQEEVAWLGAYSILWRLKHEPYDSVPIDTRLPFELLGVVTNNATAIYRLVRAGLDYQARAMLRILFESSSLALALLADAELRAGYIAAIDERDARHFWQQKLRPAAISSVLNDIEANLLLEAPDRAELAAWRKSTYEWLSQFVHPNYVVAIMGGHAWDPRDHRLDLLRPNTLGRCCAGSRSTLAKAFRLTWYFCVFFYGVASEGFRGAPRFEVAPRADVESAMVAMGFEIILSAGNRWWGINEEEGYDVTDDDSEPA